MKKNLFYTALWLMGLMGTLAIWVVNAETTISEPYGHIDYKLNGNEDFEAQVITITSWTDIITILDRNLWAKKAWTWCDYKTNWNAYCAYDDTYGYYFQRGNNYGFKPWCDLSWSTYSCTDSITSSAVQWQVDANTIEYNPSNQQYYTSWVFYKGNSNWLNDNSKVDLWWWGMTDSTDTTYSLSDDTWKVNLDTVTSRQWPCPEWFHVPSRWELDKLKNLMWNSASDIHTKLLIPFAGFRDYTDASVYRMGDYAYLWSSSPVSASTPYSRSLYLGVGGGLGVSYYRRATALSVRCFYDSYQPFTQSFTLTFGVSDDNGSTSAETGSVASGTVIVLSTGDFEATKDGWTHLWWNTDASATGVLESITMTEDTTVYAIFSKDLTVNYATWAWVSTIQKESDSCSMYNTGTSCALTAPAITEDEWYENWAWKKWNDTVNPGEDITLTSDWDTYTATASAKEFAIRFVDSNQQNVDVIYSWAYKSDTSNITYPSWTRDGYTISWDKPIPATMPLNGDTITANWTENKKPSWGSSGWGGRSKTDTDSSDKSNESQTWNQTDSDSSTWSQDDNTSDKHTEWQTYSEEFQEAYEFAKEKWITTMPTINEANMNWKLTRIAMAKMLSYYAINVLWQKPDETRINKFNDITEKLDAQYDSGVTLAYQLWIMWINMPNNIFRPNDEVTRAEFATALSRMLYGTPDWNPYYSTHLAKLKAEWILKNDDYKMKELRWYVMIMLKRSAK